MVSPYRSMALSMSCVFSLWKWASTTAMLRATIGSEVRAVEVTEAPRVALCGGRDASAAADQGEGAQVPYPRDPPEPRLRTQRRCRARAVLSGCPGVPPTPRP